MPIHLNSLKWAGPQQQSAMMTVAKDLLVANTAVSVKVFCTLSWADFAMI